MKNLLVLLLFLVVVNNSGQAQSAKTKEQVTSPATQSARWHYERALIYHLREQDGRATIELYKALEKNPDYTEANFFLALLFQNREHWEDAAKSLDRVVSAVSEHLPARIHLARARIENNDYYTAIAILDQVVAGMKLDRTFTERLKQCQSDLATRPVDPSVAESLIKDLKSRLRNLVEEIEDVMLESSDVYRSLTVARGLKDPLIYNELADLYLEQEQEDQSLKLLEELLVVREGFAPAVLLQMGKIYEKQGRYANAVAVLESAVTQLNSLGFTEAAGDYSTEELKQLKSRAKVPNKIQKK